MDPDNELAMNPGPRNPSVLHLQSSHRSTTVWEAGGGDTQRSRRRNPTQSRFPQLHQRMIPLLSDLRFDGVSRLSSINIDWSLVTAMVERWRPETHSFHLPVGECTITLQDVSVLLGLRVDGAAVTGITSTDGGWNKLIEEIFGVSPGTQLVGGRLQLSWLTKNFSSLPDTASDLEVIRYTQSYLLQLIAGVLFTDHSGGMIHCMYIPLIQDFQVCRTLAWGAAVLSYLFREMCKSCRIGTEENAGCLLLLQLWAWTRLPTIAPIPRGPSLDNSELWGNQSGPYGMRWCSQLKFAETSAHVVSTHRLALDGLAPSHFIWQPYTEFLATAPEHLTDGSTIWCYKGPLICFYIVEPHLPNRCMRQFGFIQEIPTNDGYDEYSKDLHDINLQGKQDTNWIIMHRAHLSHWDSRAAHVVDAGANFGVGVVPGYNEWYTEITRLYHTRVGGSHLFAIHLLNQISLVARGEIDGDMNYIDLIATNGRQLLEHQFNHGVFQDFPIEERRQKENVSKPKPKKVGHKGGRGGVNAPRRRGKQVADNGGIHLDQGDYNVGDGGVQLGAEGGFAGETSIHVQENQAEVRQETIVRSSLDYIPNFNLLPSNDALFMTPHSRQRLEKQTVNEHSPPFSVPSFDLGISQSPPAYQSTQDPKTNQLAQNQQVHNLSGQQPYQQAQLPHQPVLPSLAQQQPSLLLLAAQQQPALLLLAQQKPAPPSLAQQIPPEVQQRQMEEPVLRQVPEPLHMRLRERRNRHTRCGTHGRKIPNCKRLRKQY